eukprot:s1455_g21.t1
MVVVTVHFTEDNQRWSHDFEVNADVALRELKASMLNPPGNEEEQGKVGSCLGATLQLEVRDHARWQDIDSFELRLLGRRVPDFEKISEDCDLDFEYLGPQEGQIKARRDRADEHRWNELQRPFQDTVATAPGDTLLDGFRWKDVLSGEFRMHWMCKEKEPPARDKSLVKAGKNLVAPWHAGTPQSRVGRPSWLSFPWLMLAS